MNNQDDKDKLIEELYDEYVRFLSQKQIADIVTKVRTATLDEFQPIHEQKIVEAQAVERQRTLHEVDEVVKGIDDYIHHNGFLFKRSLKERLDNLRGTTDKFGGTSIYLCDEHGGIGFKSDCVTCRNLRGNNE